jgi:L-asparaginase/Glu-tRNA(Gln) amidotransferase subunit D
VLLIGYHSGTANENSVEALLKQCKKFNIPLYLQGVSYESGLYSSSENIIKKGAIPLYDMTPEYAYAYLIFKVNSTSENQC